jgi:hypothetical protein
MSPNPPTKPSSLSCRTDTVDDLRRYGSGSRRSCYVGYRYQGKAN